ncbi:GntR family transcriptional regulator [Alicyclobacillus tolerans]|uniref:GntR family transcriptional regulator n=1 Tax=Alicyclobacillus tolerans TaxID=90970 RepID=UPI001F354A2D|nr:GntR family transcriptional regulator [Alicyclobacillus tolerans]MCF8566864.1 GntR family transcriptional regulator [Alicyclobacillus tolerans]
MNYVERVQRQSLGLQIASVLRKSILVGQISSGEHLAEPLLAETFGTSRAPVREALSLMIREGFAIRERNGRVIVTAMTFRDIEDLYETRLLIEKHAIRRAVEKAVPKSVIAEMKNVLEGPIAASDFAERDVDFHELIVQLAENKFLVQSWRNTKDIFRTIIEITDNSKPLTLVHDEHKSIVSLIEHGDFDAALDLLTTHVGTGIQVMKTIISR